MVSNASRWQKMLWLFTRMGRVRLVLDRSTRRADRASRPKLQAALGSLRSVSRKGSPGTADLESRVVERLTELALNESDFEDASKCLRDLERLSAPSEMRLNLRWLLLEKLFTGAPAKALPEAKLYVADSASSPARVAEILAWAHREGLAGQLA